MEAKTRRVFSMVKRVLAFEAADPSQDASHLAAVESLKGLYATLPALIDAESLGRGTERQATLRRKTARNNLLRQARHLVNVGERAQHTDPSLEGSFIAPRHDAPNRTFLDAARALQIPLQANLELLLTSGLGGTFQEEFAAGIAAFEEASRLSDESRNAHIQGRNTLIAVADECREVVRILDGLNKARFQELPDHLDTWLAASNVYGPVKRSAEEPAPDGEPTAPVGEPTTSIETQSLDEDAA